MRRHNTARASSIRGMCCVASSERRDDTASNAVVVEPDRAQLTQGALKVSSLLRPYNAKASYLMPGRRLPKPGSWLQTPIATIIQRRAKKCWLTSFGRMGGLNSDHMRLGVLFASADLMWQQATDTERPNRDARGSGKALTLQWELSCS